jgi:predicted DNA-binding WGR domain protein
MNLGLFGSDVELRLVDASRNRFRIYGLTVCRTLFGDPCLRIVWGRLGQRRLRERSETFEDLAALDRRRDELLTRRRRHRYVPIGTDWATLLETREGPAERRERTKGAAMEREIVEAHGLSLGDRVARGLVARWHAAASELRSYVRAHGETELDLEDVSTLAAMYVAVSRVA